jgi:hypothetical protein
MPTDFRVRAAEALSLAGRDAVLTSHTALYLYGCLPAEQAAIHILVPGSRRVRSRPGVVVHHGTFAKRDVESLRGLKLLALDHALAAVLCRGAPADARRCLEHALSGRSLANRKRFTDRLACCVRARADIRGQVQALDLLRSVR